MVHPTICCATRHGTLLHTNKISVIVKRKLAYYFSSCVSLLLMFEVCANVTKRVRRKGPWVCVLEVYSHFHSPSRLVWSICGRTFAYLDLNNKGHRTTQPMGSNAACRWSVCVSVAECVHQECCHCGKTLDDNVSIRMNVHGWGIYYTLESIRLILWVIRFGI